MTRRAKITDRPTGTPSGVSLTEEQWNVWFDVFIQHGGNVSRACESCRVSREAVYSQRADNPDFEKRFQVAKQKGIDRLEDEAMRRALDGVQEPIFYQGDVCGTVMKYSDGLVQFLLGANRPDKYKARTENTNTNMNANFGGTTTQHDLSKLSKAELHTFLKLAKKIEEGKK